MLVFVPVQMWAFSHWCFFAVPCFSLQYSLNLVVLKPELSIAKLVSMFFKGEAETAINSFSKGVSFGLSKYLMIVL